MRLHLARSLALTLLLLLVALAPPHAAATESFCTDADDPRVCYADPRAKEPPSCQMDEAEERFSGAGVRAADGQVALVGGSWDSCARSSWQSNERSRTGAYVWLGSVLLDVGLNHYRNERGDAGEDFYAVHYGAGHVVLVESWSPESGTTCHVGVRVATVPVPWVPVPCWREAGASLP